MYQLGWFAAASSTSGRFVYKLVLRMPQPTSVVGVSVLMQIVCRGGDNNRAGGYGYVASRQKNVLEMMLYAKVTVKIRRLAGVWLMDIIDT